jgi:DNA polymerase I-like protein with 3'-5' exonuclease and polymerase domains/uracil-DNA glycosylase
MSSLTTEQPDAVACLNKANCELCPLGTKLRKLGVFNPVPGELNGAPTVILAPSPGKQEVLKTRPFVGATGADLLQMVKKEGRKTRHDLNWTYVVACRYPNDDPKSFHAVLKKRNRARLRKGEAAIPTPETCCTPRLDAELAQVDNVIALGASTIKATGTRTSNPALGTDIIERGPSLQSFRGAPTRTADGKLLIATRLDWQRNPMWKPIVRKDLARAFRYFDGRLDWVEPDMVTVPTPEELEAFIEEHVGKVMVYDVETRASKFTDDNKPVFDASRDVLRCIGFGNADKAMVVPFESVEPGERHLKWSKWYTKEQWVKILKILRRFFVRPDIVKGGWNNGYYDRMVIEARLGVTCLLYLDGMVLQKLGMSEYFQGLGAAASFYLDAPAWKSEHTAVTARTNAELFFYCARDICITSRLLPIVRDKARDQGQLHLYKRRTRVQRVAVSMHKLGLEVDEFRRGLHKVRLEKAKRLHTGMMRQMSGKPEMNPNSVQAQQALLYTTWNCPIGEYTDTGEASTKDSALLMLLGDPTVPAATKAYVDELRAYRKASTALSYFIDKWHPSSPWVWDGFMYPDWNATGTVGWRLSSSGPNFQNIIYYLRDCFYAGDGYTFIGIDYDQLELRYLAALAGAKLYLNAFKDDEIDTHNLTGQLVFGQEYWNRQGAPTDPRKKGKGKFKDMRDLIKTFTYGALYGASLKTIHGIIIQSPAHRHRSLAEIRFIHMRWLKAVPEIKRWWDNQIEKYRDCGFIQETVWDLKRHFANGEEYNTVINTEVQFGGAAIVHMGMFKALRSLTRAGLIGADPTTGLVIQGHDALYFRVRNEDAAAATAILDRDMVVTVPQLDVTFTAEAESSPWLDLPGPLETSIRFEERRLQKELPRQQDDESMALWFGRMAKAGCNIADLVLPVKEA